MNLENNPIATAIQKEVKKLLSEDMSKVDIKEKLQKAYPGFNEELFESCYTEAFCNLTVWEE